MTDLMADENRKEQNENSENKNDEYKNEQKRNGWFILAIISSAVYLIWRIFFTIPRREGFLQTAAGILLVLA